MGLGLFKFILPVATSLTLAAPCGLAVKKYLHAEAFIFAFTIVFQMLHHLCECPGLSIIFCLMGDDLLLYFSTHSLILSMFATLINLTKFTRTKRLTFILTVGMMSSVRVYQTTEGYGVYSAPIAIAVLLLTYSWGQQIYSSKKLYPEKQIWMKTILPALLFASFSMVMLFCVENRSTDNEFMTWADTEKAFNQVVTLGCTRLIIVLMTPHPSLDVAMATGGKIATSVASTSTMDSFTVFIIFLSLWPYIFFFKSQRTARNLWQMITYATVGDFQC